MLTYFNPLTWGRWFREFAYGWFVSLPWWNVPRAIPAMLVMVALVVGGVVAHSGVAGWRNELIGRQFAEAWQVDDFPTAELVLRRQLSQRPEDADLLFKLAMVRENRDAHEEAAELMRKLVAIKKHQSAARWLLEKEYLNRPWTEFTEPQKHEFGQLLSFIHDESPKDMGIVQLFAEYSLARQNFPKAITLLEMLAPLQPMRGLQAAAISRQMGNDATANRLASRALEQVDQLAQEDPTNNMLRLAIAQNQMFLRRHAEAVRTLEKGIQLAKTPQDAEQLQQALGDAFVAWIAFIEETPSNTTDERLRILKMLQSALQYAPNNPRVLMLVADQVLKSVSDEDEAIVATRDALIAGTSPGISHFIQGTAAMIKEDTETAEMHLRMAAKFLPKSGVILNNLAVAMASREGSNLDLALKVSESAISQTPDATPHFYETRGQILVKLERYLDAVPDLERALSVVELASSAHESLAVCYDKLGQDELSRQHRQAAGK